MKAIGKNSKGETLEFEADDKGRIWCVNLDLVELVIPEGVIEAYCYNNLLTELKIPNSIEKLSCRNNQLKSLIVPTTVKKIWCNKDVISNIDELKNTNIYIVYFK